MTGVQLGDWGTPLTRNLSGLGSACSSWETGGYFLRSTPPDWDQGPPFPPCILQTPFSPYIKRGPSFHQKLQRPAPPNVLDTAEMLCDCLAASCDSVRTVLPWGTRPFHCACNQLMNPPDSSQSTGGKLRHGKARPQQESKLPPCKAPGETVERRGRCFPSPTIWRTGCPSPRCGHCFMPWPCKMRPLREIQAKQGEAQFSACSQTYCQNIWQNFGGPKQADLSKFFWGIHAGDQMGTEKGSGELLSRPQGQLGCSEIKK